MKPGRELDALVAEKVMGWTKLLTPEGEQIFDYWRSPEPYMRNCTSDDIPQYSTDIAAAWQVIDKLTAGDETDEDPIQLTRGHRLRRLYSSADWHSGRNSGWWALFVTDGTPGYGAYGDTAPHAICLAALAAVGVKP